MNQLINHQMLSKFAEAGVVIDVKIVAKPEGWEVIALFGVAEAVLTAQRGKVRLFRNLNTVVTYLSDMGIKKFHVDAEGFDSVVLKSSRHNEAARERLNFAFGLARKNKEID